MRKGGKDPDPEPDPYLWLMDPIRIQEAQKHADTADPDPVRIRIPNTARKDVQAPSLWPSSREHDISYFLPLFFGDHFWSAWILMRIYWPNWIRMQSGSDGKLVQNKSNFKTSCPKMPCVPLFKLQIFRRFIPVFERHGSDKFQITLFYLTASVCGGRRFLTTGDSVNIML
jgi:hypothetical protein